RPQVAVVDADDAGVRRARPLQLGLVVGLHDRLQPDLQRTVDEPGEPLRRMEYGQEQDEVRASGAEMRELDVLDDELLGEDRDADGSPNGPQVVDRATEPVRLAQHGDRGGATGLVRT